jgi:hypothetical protein
MNKALHQKAKEKRNKTILRTWDAVIMYNSYMFCTQRSLGVTGHFWWTLALEMYEQFHSSPSARIFGPVNFNSVFFLLCRKLNKR